MTEHMDSSRADWWRLAGVGVIAIVLSLIGSNVASRFQPPADTEAILAADEETTTTTTTTATTVPAPASLPSEETTTTVAPSEPATLALSDELLDFGEDGDALELEIAHTGGGRASWDITSDSPNLSFSPAEGELSTGGSVVVTVSLDRSEFVEGDFASVLTLTWAHGELTADVAAVAEDNPIIHNPQASPGTVQVDAGAGCSPTMTTISARVRDTTEVDQVIARWSPDGSATRETAMSPVGNDIYEGVIGPFSVVRNDSVKIVAFDVRGNAGGASISVTVAACS